MSEEKVRRVLEQGHTTSHRRAVLEPSALLQSLAGGDSENTSSQVRSLELYLPEGKTYNLTVDVGHTFYVGELKTWVHNTGPCDLHLGGGRKAATTVSGPAKGFVEVNDAYSSSKAVQQLGNSKPIDFIYDPVTQRFIMGRNQFGHDGVLNAGKIASSDAIVGGDIWKENGFLAHVWSGHYEMMLYSRAS